MSPPLSRTSDERHLDEVVAAEMNQLSRMMRELDDELRRPAGPASIASATVVTRRVDISLKALQKRLYDEGMRRL